MDSTSTCIPCGKGKVTAIRSVMGLVFLAMFLALYYNFCLKDLLQSDTLSEQADDTDQHDNTYFRSAASLAASASAHLIQFKVVQLCVRPFQYLVRKVTGFFIVILSWFLNNHGSEILKILISFGQVSGTFATNYSIQWPSGLAEFLNALNFVNASLKALPGNLACSMTGLSYRQLQYVYLLAPIFLLGLMGLPAFYVAMCREHARHDVVMKRLASNCCFILFLLYPIVSGPALKNLMCVEIGGGEERLKEFLEEPCHPKIRTSPEYALGVALVVIYPIGGLFILASMLWYYDIHKMAKHKIEEAHLHSLITLYKRATSKTLGAKIANEIGGAISLLTGSGATPDGEMIGKMIKCNGPS